MKKIALLGSTGSIGQSTLSLCESHPDCFHPVASPPAPTSAPALLRPKRSPAPTAISWIESPRFIRIALAIVFVLNLIPIWSVDYPGMVDYPNHLTRCYILAHIHTDPVLAERYIVLKDPIPNLAIEAIVVPLNHVLPIILCGKLFLTLAAILFILGCVWLGHAITGKRSVLALAAAFLFYNSNFFYGFVNYIFGLSIFLCVFAYWVRVRSRMSWSNFAILCFLSLIAFFAHLSSVAFLSVACFTVACVDFAKAPNPHLFIRQLAWLLCPLVPMFGFLKSSGTVGTIEWSTLKFKFANLFAPIRSYSLTVDCVVLALGILTVVLLLRTGRLNRVAVAGVALFVMFLVTPHVIFTSSAADVRYVTPACVVFFLSIEPVWGRRERLVFTLLLAALVVRTVEIVHDWRLIDHREAQLLHMGDSLPRDARVLSINKYDRSIAGKLDRSFVHVINYWTFTHDASVSSLFTNPGQQPIIDRTKQCKEPVPSCIVRYDYVWTNVSDPDNIEAVEATSVPIDRWGTATLWRVRHLPKDNSAAFRARSAKIAK